jgi:hypothetical protein
MSDRDTSNERQENKMVKGMTTEAQRTQRGWGFVKSEE